MEASRVSTIGRYNIGLIEAVFQVKGRGCVIMVDRDKIEQNPYVKAIEIDDQLRVVTSDGRELRTSVAGGDVTSVSTKLGLYLRDVHADMMQEGDLLMWVGRPG